MTNETPNLSLVNLMSAIETSDYDHYAYVHRPSGEIFLVSEEEMELVESGKTMINLPERVREKLKRAQHILQAAEEYIPVPQQYDFREVHVMEEFCTSLEDKNVSAKLFFAVKGKGASERFHDMISEVDLHGEWFEFRQKHLREFAATWCHKEGLTCDEEISS